MEAILRKMEEDVQRSQEEALEKVSSIQESQKRKELYFYEKGSLSTTASQTASIKHYRRLHIGRRMNVSWISPKKPWTKVCG